MTPRLHELLDDYREAYAAWGKVIGISPTLRMSFPDELLLDCLIRESTTQLRRELCALLTPQDYVENLRPTASVEASNA